MWKSEPTKLSGIKSTIMDETVHRYNDMEHKLTLDV